MPVSVLITISSRFSLFPSNVTKARNVPAAIADALSNGIAVVTVIGTSAIKGSLPSSNSWALFAPSSSWSYDIRS